LPAPFQKPSSGAKNLAALLMLRQQALNNDFFERRSTTQINTSKTAQYQQLVEFNSYEDRYWT
jgi:hypothetical protein